MTLEPFAWPFYPAESSTAVVIAAEAPHPGNLGQRHVHTSHWVSDTDGELEWRCAADNAESSPCQTLDRELFCQVRGPGSSPNSHPRLSPTMRRH
jgi:hypothetical protein